MAKSTTKVTEGMRTNKTGITMSSHADAMRQVPELTRATPANGGLKQAHAVYLKESHAVGTVPPPATAKGVAKSAWQAIKGNKAIALVDRTAERLAFERTGVRLYTALLEKLEIGPSFAGGPTRDEVETIRSEELQHALMLAEALEQMGADPTVMTPSADLVSVEGMGLGQVVNDARTTVGQCLHAMMVAELADGEGWTLLRTLADDMGQDELSSRFSRAEQEEERHLEQVRSWLLAHARAEAEIG
jgi:rubrerythrin